MHLNRALFSWLLFLLKRSFVFVFSRCNLRSIDNHFINVSFDVNLSHQILIYLGNLYILLHLLSVLFDQLFKMVVFNFMLSLCLSNGNFFCPAFLVDHRFKFFDLIVLPLDLNLLILNLSLKVGALNLPVFQSVLRGL